jgi:hypothetical protein
MTGAHRWVLAALLASVVSAVPAHALTWEHRWSLTSERNGRLEFTMTRTAPGHRSQWTNDVDASALKGFDRRALSGARTPVRFEIEREAGTAVFEGTAGSGRASGTYSWSPDGAFQRDAGRALGTSLDDPTMLMLWESDVRIADIREAQGILRGGVRLEDVQQLAIHGAHADRLRPLREAGLRDVAASGLVQLLIHQVRADEVATLRNLRNAPPDPEELVNLHIHGVTPREIQELAVLGYGGVSDEDIIQLHIHSVAPGFIRGYQDLGYDRLSTDELVQLKIHDVSPAFAKKTLAVMEKRPSVRMLIDLKLRGFGD